MPYGRLAMNERTLCATTAVTVQQTLLQSAQPCSAAVLPGTAASAMLSCPAWPPQLHRTSCDSWAPQGPSLDLIS